MTKLMIAAAAAVCATVGLAEGEIASANIVGYNTVTTEAAKAYPSFSACFVPVDGSSSYKLKDIKPTGMQAMMSDVFQTLNPATTVADNQYTYFSYEESRSLDPDGGYDSYIGWWKGSLGEEDANESPISVGQAFLGQIVSGSGIDIQSSGEAPTYTTKYTTDGSAYPFFGSYIPKDLKLKDIVVVGMQAMMSDVVQALNPATTVAENQYTYFSYEESRSLDPDGGYDSYIGWWKGSLGEEDASETPVPAGTAFLGQIVSGDQAIEFKFPSVTAE